MNYKAINYWVMGGFEGEMEPARAIDTTREMGLDGLELTFGDVLHEDISPAECREIREYADAKNVGLKTLASGFYWGCSLASPDVEEREKAMTFTEKYLRTAANLSIETILLVPGAVDVPWDVSRPVVPYLEVWDNATRSLKAMLPLAEELKVDIGIENVWNKFLLSPIEMKFFIEQFESSRIGSYLDLGNVLLIGYPEHWIGILGKHIKAVHVKNFSRNDCGGGLHGFGESLLKGDLDYQKTKEALLAIHYKGPLTVEMIPFSRMPDLALPDMDLARKVVKELRELF